MKDKGRGQVRIIAGRWRGRRLPVPDVPGLRPTGDRARETLFNWLQPRVEGADCADLFAGSGALGFEAASRGARSVQLVESSPVAALSLEETARGLKAARVHVHKGDVLDWLAGCRAQSLDLVFADPPFDSGLAVRTLQMVARGGVLRPRGLVYVEMPARLPELLMQPPFALHRESVVGEIRMRLFRCSR